MIFVVTGLHSLPFNRLIRAMDELAESLEEDIIIQKGCSRLALRYAKGFEWATSDEMDTHFTSARLVVSHAGVGTILDCRRHLKPIIVVPRRKGLGEASDDHQTEICEALSKSKAVICVADTNRLREVLTSHVFLNGITPNRKPNLLIETIRGIVDEAVARDCR